jgi:hypothetical protein
LAVVFLAAVPVRAQRPILPICSDDPAYKLPPCHAATPAPPSTSQPSAPATQFPFPGADASTAPVSSTPSTSAPTAPAEQFPFPGETPAAAAPAQTGASAPAVPATPAANQFPFPGESVPLPVIDPKEKAYDPNDPDDTKSRHAGPPSPPAPPSQPIPPDSASSSSSSSSDSVPELKDEGSEGSTRASRRLLPKVEDLTAREEEDIKVAKFYHSTGNYLAAYNRAKDALKIDPKDPEAQLALAINAQKLSKKDEAIAAYTAYLKLSPDGDDVKLAQRALASLK